MSDALVKGMGMPKGCYECPFLEEHCRFTGDEWVCGCRVIGKIVSDDGEKDSDCPLVKVKPHGRLIDADEFKASIHMNHLGKFATNRDVQVLYRLLDEAPTVLEANND